jgi:hypothetical protein
MSTILPAAQEVTQARVFYLLMAGLFTFQAE